MIEVPVTQQHINSSSRATHAFSLAMKDVMPAHHHFWTEKKVIGFRFFSFWYDLSMSEELQKLADQIDRKENVEPFVMIVDFKGEDHYGTAYIK